MENTQNNALILDKEFRQKLRDNPQLMSQDLGINPKDGATIVVKTNTRNIVYLPLSSTMDDTDMTKIFAAGEPVKASSIATVGTTTSLSCPASTLSSAGSVSSISSGFV